MFRTAPHPAIESRSADEIGAQFAEFVFRENRVPYYQRLFQQHDGKRQWWKTDRSKYIMYPYLISVYGLGAATTYAMIRMVFGHKTWFGKD
ncbi:hypothetical protein BDV26DRAFT_290532 [Aspergillus bertholletiae]|uniref:Uncharacterized protein n=1 Tax=Aspergillus bertholletiae TaxID=1226010 RepID=A0A5N7BFA3_9EURO|nr:hypothetical protein BDV26DRAFT_290532 [Aspergillus bertholletiae]